jgi:hypothetical protein
MGVKKDGWLLYYLIGVIGLLVGAVAAAVEGDPAEMLKGAVGGIAIAILVYIIRELEELASWIRERKG